MAQVKAGRSLFRYNPDDRSRRLSGVEQPDQARILTVALEHEIRASSLPSQLPVVGHVQIPGGWGVLLKPAGERQLSGVVLSGEEYGDYRFDPYAVAARVLGSATLRALVAGSEEVPPELGDAYALFLAGDSGSPAPVYCSHVPQDGTATKDPGSGSRWADMVLSRVIDPVAESIAQGVEPSAQQAEDHSAGDVPQEQLAARLAVAELLLQRRTRVLWLALVLAVVLPLLAAGGVWVAVRAELDRLRGDKVDLVTLADGLCLNTEEISAEDALRAKLRDLATVSVQSGAWQEGLRSRGVEPGELLDHLVTLSTVRHGLSRLAANEPALSDLARAQPVLARLVSSESALTRLATAEEPLANLAAAAVPLADLTASSEQLAGVATNSAALARLAAEADALVALADRQESLAAVAEAGTTLARLVRQRDNLLALASRRAELEAGLRHAATLDTMVPELARALTFLEQRQADLEQLAKRREALLQLTSSQAQLTELARDQQTLDQLAASGRELIDLARDIHLRRLVDNDKALDVLTTRLDDLVQLTLRANQLLQLVAPGQPPR